MFATRITPMTGTTKTINKKMPGMSVMMQGQCDPFLMDPNEWVDPNVILNYNTDSFSSTSVKDESHLLNFDPSDFDPDLMNYDDSLLEKIILESGFFEPENDSDLDYDQVFKNLVSEYASDESEPVLPFLFETDPLTNATQKVEPDNSLFVWDENQPEVANYEDVYATTEIAESANSCNVDENKIEESIEKTIDETFDQTYDESITDNDEDNDYDDDENDEENDDENDEDYCFSEQSFNSSVANFKEEKYEPHEATTASSTRKRKFTEKKESTSVPKRRKTVRRTKRIQDDRVKDQNKMAASKYRKKKREEMSSLDYILEEEEEKNKKLKAMVDEQEVNIKVLKELLGKYLDLSQMKMKAKQQ